jgi:hypothetical protein
MNPSEILRELQELMATQKRATGALYEAEEALARSEHLLDTTEAKSFISHSGSVAEKNALSRLESADARLQRDLAKAQVNRIRTKIRVIESSMMALGTMSKLMQAEMKL